ncbi:unnamed protein product [Toxocara canis]|uniref:ADP-ribosylation factor-binding protein GGA1 n=1 Tax=Toxocara canis TaxID=6265 RepID=A0A183V4Z8_TOXCA|nr:unnamed protein product [Toxocara canis]
MEENDERKPLEYWITRATDPFVTEEDRVKYVDALCERVSEEAEGPQIAVRIFAHKLLSPDQAEAMNALKAIDMCVRRCGTRVHNEIAKFRFLNQIVRLLSPKVYDMLKEQKVILEDPPLISDPIRVTPPCRLATFEDEEKASLLSQLLKSNNPEDLQAANRLIKSMVRSEEQKMERLHKRVDDVEKAKNNCRVLNEILAYCNTEPMSERENELAAELYSVLVEIRPSLFRYAGEAAEYDDAALADILAVNDAVNKTVQQYKSLFPDRKPASKTSPAKDLISAAYKRSRNGSGTSASKAASSRGSRTSIVDLLSSDAEASATNAVSLLDRDALRLVDNGSHGSSLCDDVALICISSTSEQNGREGHPENDSSSSALDDLSLLLDQSAFRTNMTELGDTTEDNDAHPKDNVQTSVQSLGSISSAVAAFASGARFSLNSVSFSLEQIHIAPRPPLVIFDENFMRGMLYFSQNSPPGTRYITTTVITMSSTNTVPLTNIKLSVSTKTPNVQSRLFDAESDALPPFSPMGAHSTISQILLVLPLTDSIETAEFDFVLLFSASSPKMISGSFSLHL